MADSLALIGQAKVGLARLGWPTDATVPPAVIRANGGCWGLVQDPGIVEAAQAAAEAKADAIAKADAAEAAAIAASTIIAQAKADTAESNATASAATDAQTKATKAKTDAIAAAKTASDLSASGAKQEAIDAAKVDATTKADAAREAAKTAAALDATAKADQAKADATTAAANDATAKANTAQAAAIAAAATDATAKAGQAKTDAIASATTMTNGIGKNLSSAAAPTTSNKAPNGSIWRRTDSSGRIIGAWEQTGAGIAGTWTPRLISSEAVDNLDVGKLSASSGVINDLVAQTFAAKTASFQTVDIKNLFATTGTMAEAVINKLFTDVVKARIAIAEEFIGENAMLTGSITAPKITASEEMSAKLGEFLRVKTGMLEADAIDGMVITGAIFQSPGDGAGFQLTENGYTSRDDDGNVTVRIPADGSTAQFRGDLEAKSLTASGRVSFQAPENEITSGAAMVLESGVQAPASPPTVGDAYETTTLGVPADAYRIAGLAYANSLWWRVVDLDTLTGNRGRVEGLMDAGAVSVSFNTGDFIGRNGLTVIGSEMFLLGPKTGMNDRRWVRVYSMSGTQQREWEYTEYGTGKYQPAIGTDGASVVIAQARASGELDWRFYSKTTGVQSSGVPTGLSYKSDVVGLYIGAADFGATRVVVSRSNGVTNVFTSAGSAVTAGGWRSSHDGATVGLAYGKGKFWHLTPDGVLIGYSGFQDTSGDTDDWWMTQSWVGPSGRETMVGPPQRFMFMRRSELQLSGGEMPPGVTGARFYLARKSTPPSRADFHLVASVAGAKARLDVLPSNWATLATPSATNTLPNTDPGLIKSRIGGFVARGDGSGQWGPLVFNADGSMSSSAVPVWVPVTTFKPGFGPQSFGYVPAYRVWPDGKVEWRGTVGGNMDVTLPILEVPAGARPAQAVNTVAATTGAVNTIRVEFRSNANPNDLMVYPVGTTRSWISLEGIFYYLV